MFQHGIKTTILFSLVYSKMYIDFTASSFPHELILGSPLLITKLLNLNSYVLEKYKGLPTSSSNFGKWLKPYKTCIYMQVSSL